MKRAGSMSRITPEMVVALLSPGFAEFIQEGVE